MAREFPIVTKLGGREELAQKLRAKGHSIGADAIRMWTARGNIPGDAARLLMAICEDERIKYRSADFAISAQESAA